VIVVPDRQRRPLVAEVVQIAFGHSDNSGANAQIAISREHFEVRQQGDARQVSPERGFLGLLQPQVDITDRLVTQPRDKQDSGTVALPPEAVGEKLVWQPRQIGVARRLDVNGDRLDPGHTSWIPQKRDGREYPARRIATSAAR